MSRDTSRDKLTTIMKSASVPCTAHLAGTDSRKDWFKALANA